MKINLDNIKNTIVYITPNFPNRDTVRYRFPLTRLLMWLFGYSTILVIITMIILGVTPLKNLIYHFENAELKEQAAKTIELENKIVFLTKELESISSTNKKLEYAFILATTDSLDTNSAAYDSLKYEPNENLPYGGNLYYIFNKLISTFFEDDNQDAPYFLKPSKGIIINKFDDSKGHLGIDFAVGKGTEVFAAQGGLVIFADFTINDGYKIIIQHNDGFTTVYKHCLTLFVKEREHIIQGELIALSGNSGKNTTGPHLHFEIWKEGKPINPKKFLIK